ncbi:carbohydrate-binding module family 13 protein [Amanita thiersii Skay4041]|uniref:Carbohydrate-binding module family 13 protein n=1 Tax=Amanita thiersii Skay4041 TaxID=703135 RepID=A0A2A9NL95_9AGAR|nr:carbohydrate-binding module family 13 protein [Amanita thiersii Skay4041]
MLPFRIRKLPLAASGILLLSQLANAQTPAFRGQLLIEPGLTGTKCLTAASNSNGAGVTLQGCTGAESQHWEFTGGRIVVFGNKCLDVPGGNAADGTKLQIYTCADGNQNQQWYYTWWDNHISWTPNRGKCLDLSAGSTADGNHVQLWGCGNTINQVWNVGYLASALPQQSQDEQFGTNQCGTTSSQDSKCQTAWINSAEDFCLWAPPTPGNIGDTERYEVAWCTKSGRGTRVIPDGTLKGVHFVKTPDYVQVTGVGDFTKMNIPAGDAGGELDNRGADGRGNPIGGLLFGNTFSPALQYHEWTSFISEKEFCFRACIGPNAARLCNHIYDVMGCYWNMPANYDEGVYENCDGDNDEPMGVYGTSTWHQGESPTPPPHSPASSSNCHALPTVSSGPANRRRETGHFEYIKRAIPHPTITPIPTP